ncbi:FecR domain-containing protein [Elusimicrobiota bacterium]
MKFAIVCVASILLAGNVLVRASNDAAVLEVTKSRVQIARAKQLFRWTTATSGIKLFQGDRIRTSSRGRAVLITPDESKIEIGGSTVFIVDFMKKQEEYSFKIPFGRIKAFAKRMFSRRFSVVTPTAVCAVRGTEFEVIVAKSGVTDVSLADGLLAVSDTHGNEMILNPNESINITHEGLGERTTHVPGQEDAGATDDDKQKAKREVGLDMTKEEVMAAAAEEMKLAEYQLGKNMIDVFGNRVRLEQYIMRPNPRAFKLVTLNDREDRFDYFYYQGTFNDVLPNNLKDALKYMSGKAGSSPYYYQTGYEKAYSNTTDKVVLSASGGHLVDVNNNVPAGDDISLWLDPDANEFVSTVGRSFWETLFDDGSEVYNDVNIYSWTPSGAGNIQAYAGNITETYYNSATPASTTENPVSEGVFHTRVKSVYDDVWVQYDMYIVSDEGNVATHDDFANVTSGTDYLKTLLEWNYEQVITSSLFGNRKIDLVFEPKTLIQSGILSYKQ